MMEMLGHITSFWSSTQAQILHLLIKGHTQTEVAELLNMSQPNISAHAVRAGWPAIKDLLTWYEHLIIKHYGQ